jgi:hypothetical protein
MPKVILTPLSHKGQLPKKDNLRTIRYYNDTDISRGLIKVAKHSLRLGEAFYLTKPSNLKDNLA